MRGSRGPRARPYPRHPNRVLARAMRTGLSTAVYLQRTIQSKTTRHLYESSRDILRRYTEAYRISKVMGNPNFTHVMKAEHNIRKNGLDMLEENAALYGCTETTRARRWYEEVGPLNQRFNVGGAALREFGAIYYPMGQPQPLFNEKGEHIDYGYAGDSRWPAYPSVHRFLTELDFMDALRQHIQVLNTDAYIHDVSVRDTRRYSNLFILRARTYLDHLYTEFEHGSPGFRDGTVRLLREIRDDIAAHHGVRVGEPETVSSHAEYPRPRFSMDFFEEQLAEAQEGGVSPAVIGEFARILSGGSEVLTDEHGKKAPRLTSDDVSHLWQSAVRWTKRVGAQVHRRITDRFDRFLDVRRAIRDDDRDGAGGGLRIVAELPLETSLGKGRADLVVFRREATPTGLRTLWRPVMVVEIKTRCGFKWYMEPERRSSSSRKRYGMVQRVVPRFRLSLRPLSPNEWVQVVDGTPEPNTVTQLDAYAEALSEAFGSIAHLESPPRVIRATLVMDPTDESRESRRMIRGLVVRALESSLTDDLSGRRTTYEVSRNGLRPRMALVVHSQDHTPDYRQPSVPQEWRPPYDPLTGAGIRARRFILYVSAASPTSAGSSAAWIAGHYHGLQMIHQLRESTPDLRVVWLDLADEFPTTSFGAVRFRARLRPAENGLPDAVQETLQSIEFKPLFAGIQAYLYNDGPMLDLSRVLEDKVKQPRLLVVSGWDAIEGSTPSPYRDRKNRLLAELVDRLSDDEQTTILWFSRPVKYERRTPIYSTNCLIPVRDTSPLVGELDEIIWNLPCAPERVIDPDSWHRQSAPRSPMFDDIRVVVAQSSSGFETSLLHIPVLRHWATKFRTEEYDRAKTEMSELQEQVVPKAWVRERIRSLALSLLPWLADLWPNTEVSPGVTLSDAFRDSFDEFHESMEGLTITRRSVSREPADIPPLLHRLRYRPPRTRGQKTFADIFLGQINAHRLYRGPKHKRSKARDSYPKTVELPKPRIASFGQIVYSEDPDQPISIVALEDPRNPARVLVGFFNKRLATRPDGMQWAESDISERIDSVRELMDTGSRISLALQQNNGDWLFWTRETEESDWILRSIFDFIPGRATGSIAMLRATRQGPILEPVSRRSTDILVPASLSHRLEKAVGRVLRRIQGQTDVSVELSWTDEGCRVDIKNEDDESLQMIEHHFTPNLIETLTLTSKGLPVRLSSGHMVSWDRFNDIEYGDLSLMANVSETFIPETADIRLPARIADLQALPCGKEISFRLSHNENECPLASGEGKEHGRCWQSILEGENERISDAFCGLFTDREIILRLGTESIVFDSTIHPVKVILPSDVQRENMVFRESPLIRKILRKSGLEVSSLKPGTYLRAEQQRWEISLTIRADWLEWAALSSLTGEYWKNRSFTYKLDVVRELSEVLDDLWRNITSEIPEESIYDPEAQRARIRSALEARGLRDGQMPARLEADLQRRTLTLEVKRAGEVDELLDSVSWELPRRIDADEVVNSILQLLDEGDWSRFHIVNVEEFFEVLEGFFH